MKKLRNRLTGIFVVPIGLAITLILFSLSIGWDPVTLFSFWFLLVPVLTLYLPTLLLRSKNNVFDSLFGLIIFYGLMIWMIYEHYQTDYFQIMIVSLVINIVIVFVISLIMTQRAKVR